MEWYVYALLGAFLVALSDVAAKRLLFKEHALEYLSTRAITTLIILVLVFPLLPQVPSVPVLLLVFFLSLVITLSLWLEARTLRHLEISVMQPLYNLSPFFLLVFAFFFLGEQLSVRQGVGIALLVIGAYVLELRHDRKGWGAPLKVLVTNPYMRYFLLVLVLFSGVSAFEKHLFTQGVDAVVYLYWVWVFISIDLLIVDWFLFRWKEMKRDLRRYGLWTFLISFLHVASLYFHFLGVALAPVSLVLPIRRLSTLFATFLGGRMYHEKGLSRRVVACLILLVGAILIIV